MVTNTRWEIRRRDPKEEEEPVRVRGRKKLVGIYPCFHVMFDVFMSRFLSREKA
jgi:hypothetical protein